MKSRRYDHTPYDPFGFVAKVDIAVVELGKERYRRFKDNKRPYAWP
jgi:hypothetical protein